MRDLTEGKIWIDEDDLVNGDPEVSLPGYGMTLDLDTTYSIFIFVTRGRQLI